MTKMNSPKLISFIIPVYNSEQTIEIVCSKIIEEVSKLESYAYEIILVNDYSTDESYEVCKNLAKHNFKIRFLSFSQNFGKHHALMAGFRVSEGDYVICLDDDLQNPPEEIHKLIQCLEKDNYDVVFGKPIIKQHTLIQNFGSYLNGVMANLLIRKPKELKISSMFIIKRYIVEEIIKYDNPYPYIEGLILTITKNIGNVLVRHDPRISGKSNFSFFKLLRLWLNGFTSFSVKPLRLASIIGVFLFITSFIFSVVLIIRKLTNNQIEVGYTSLAVLIIFFGSIQLLSIGLLGEYIGRIFICINKSPQYVIKEIYNVDKRNDEL